jgi:predicted lactoylglutathione lyase
VYHLRVQEKDTTSCATIDETIEIFLLSSHNFDNYTLIAFGDVVSSNNVAGLCSIFNASNNQLPIIDDPIINLVDL